VLTQFFILRERTFVEPESLMPPTKSNEAWLKDKLVDLLAWAKEVGTVSPDSFQEYRYHTALKLAALAHAVDVFSTVARHYVDDGRFASSVFLDLFAGSGLNAIDRQHHLAGSSIIAAKATRPFDRIVSVEADSDKAKVLSKRLKAAGVRHYKVITGDCNEQIAEALKFAGGKRSLVFLCVDPEGLEARWATIQRVSSNYGAMDVFVNMTHGAERELGAVRSIGRESPALENLMGLPLDQILLNDSTTASGLYQSQIQNVLGRNVGGSSMIRGTNNQPVYTVMLFTRTTKGASPYREGYNAMHRRLSTLTVSHVEGALNDIDGTGLFGVGSSS